MARIKSALCLILLLSLLILTTITSSAVANSDVVRWSGVNIPTEGKLGNWVLADGSDVQYLTQAIDGTLYCCANPSGTSYTLFKSTDEGRSWSYTGRVEDDIVALVTAPDDANVIYYATLSNIYKSTDAGASFTLLAVNPGGAGSNNIEIISIDVASLGSNNMVAVGTRDTDDLEYGGVYRLDENRLSSDWVDTNLGSYDVYAVVFSPNFTTDQQLVAVVTDEKDTFITSMVGGAGWGEVIGDAKLDSVVATSAAIAFPDDYDATEHYVLFIAIGTDSNSGDVYMIDGIAAPDSPVATDLNIGSAYGLSDVDVTGLAVTGGATSANILAGAADSARVYFSINGGIDWTRGTKEPTGEGKTCVLMVPDFAGSGKAYAATSGDESALSYTTDGGTIWNQLSLIDTKISDIVDLAPSPNYSQDNTLFMVTYGGEHSLWRSLSGGATWERVYSSVIPNVDIIDMVELSPQYGNGSSVVFIAGTSSGNPAIWKSMDNGQSFIRRFARDPATSASFPIKTWAVVDDNTLFAGSYDGSNGVVYRTVNSGLIYSTKAVAGDQSLYSIALSPSYEQDETILVGSRDGWVYWSNDNGISFEPLGQQLPLSPVTGKANITIAFDPRFSSNDTVYAASDTEATIDDEERIYRFIIGTSANWESIDSTLPVTAATGSVINQLVVSASGTLYAANSMPDGGMERCLSPTYSLGPAFETVTRRLDDGASLTGLWLCDNRLWSVDSANIKLMTYTDSLTEPVTLTSPPDRATGIGTGNVSLDWETLSGATSYEWQLDYDTDFSNAYEGDEGDTQVSPGRLPTFELATTYYWRVRATEPVLSPWSSKWSFTTPLGGEVTASRLLSPEAGARGESVKPIFQWSAVAGADSYELLVSTDASLANPVIIKIGAYALPGTAWQCDVELDYDTAYYWKVRAISATTYSAWSAVNAFTTESPPVLSETIPSYSTAPELYSPEAGARGESVKPIFQWSAIAGAHSYELLVSTDVSFTSSIIIKIGACALPSTAWQCDVELDYDTTYYWKVRACSSEPYSAWSAVGAFTTESSPVSEPPPGPPPSHSIAPVLNTPEAGSRGESVKPIFQWSAVAGADSYELLVSTDASLTNPIIIKIGAYALPSTAWQCDVELDYTATYYWKVRAISTTTHSAWSAVSAFTTESSPSPEPSPEPSPSAPPSVSPQPLPQPATPDWAKWLMGLSGVLLLTMVAMLITMVILTARLWKF